MAQIEPRRLMQFLMGLRDTFAQPRSQLLLNVNLPTVKSAYSLLLQDESQRVQSEGYERPVDHSALQAARIGIDAPNPLQSHISSTPHFTAAANQSSTNRAHASSSTSPPGNNRPRPRCAHCGTLGHTQQVCYKLHGYPPGHKFYKKGNTNSQTVTAQSTSPIPSESLQQLIRLLQEVKEPKANLVGKSLALTSIFNISNEWVIDTGATDHVCFNLSIFTELPKYNNIVTNISVPTGNAIPVCGLPFLHGTPDHEANFYGMQHLLASPFHIKAVKWGRIGTFLSSPQISSPEAQTSITGHGLKDFHATSRPPKLKDGILLSQIQDLLLACRKSPRVLNLLIAKRLARSRNSLLTHAFMKLSMVADPCRRREEELSNM
nr:Retrovirus-related Pol polyprotein from transposon TNT 1-94 [Ipomoea batatas]